VPGWALVVAAVLTVGSAPSCGKGGQGTAPASGRAALAAADTDRFPHGLHTGSDPRIRGFQGRGLACADCHPAQAVMRGEIARPGTQQHAPCDSCHKEEFFRPPGPFCKVCHSAVEPREAGKSPLAPYPERGFQRLLASEFSHAAHLDAGKMEGAVGFHLACADCHVRDEKSRDPKQPSHAECARCHGGDGKAGKTRAAASALPMTACAKCHPSRDVELSRGRKLITGDLIFAHAAHERDAANQPIP
jgi:hypothetical protein